MQSCLADVPEGSCVELGAFNIRFVKSANSHPQISGLSLSADIWQRGIKAATGQETWLWHIGLAR
ncbi:hypothetical protein ABIB90_008526 [Bradyrhizobium sp. JR4.1]